MGASTDRERERDRYVEWLRSRGASEEDIAAHRLHAGKILDCVDDGGPVQPADVDEAVAAERAAGAPEARLGNLRRVGDFLQQFQRESPPSRPPPREPVTADFNPPEPEMDTADIELATPRPRPRPGRVSAPPPRPTRPPTAAPGGGRLVIVIVIVIVTVLGLVIARG